jgi:hypothetical protein
MAGQRSPEVGGEGSPPLTSTRGTIRDPPVCHVQREDDVGTHEPAGRRDQAPEQRHADGERWVGDHPKRATGEPEVRGVSLHHGDALTGECPAQPRSTSRMELKRNDVGAAVKQWPDQGPGARPDVEHEISRLDSRVGNDLSCPMATELMPSPTRPFRGHAAPS